MAVRLAFVLLFMLSITWNSDARQLSELHPKEEVSRNENICTLCEEFAAEALDYLNDNKTQTEIIEQLHESCSRMPTFKQQCITLVDYYAPLFFLEVSSIQPGDFCQKVNLCEKMALLSAEVKEDSCQLCHHAVSEVLEKLKDPNTQMDILEALMNACNSMEKKYVKKCKRMVFEYGPLVLANAEQFLESKDLCTALHACKSDGISAQDSSSETIVGLSTS
ncbi:prosaposin [Punica granatum]|uniref:Prosaposin n=2 Tax=Punica granatum TaxID=22663 RepID=A0A6P8DRV1_PUNGR|nr:prosaposin [Punica granatum]XP_031398685.1 prosaposin [Punica granatum]PKI62921.1 hypothetical protein CRG98_016680 [Punica granatum]